MFTQLQYRLNGNLHVANPRPTGLDTISLSTDKEPNQCFYRTKWQGEISFHGADFERIWQAYNQAFNQQLFIHLYAEENRAVPSWTGKIPLTAIAFDIDKREARLIDTPKPDDGYQTLLERWHSAIYWLPSIRPLDSTSREPKWLLTHLLASMVRITLADTLANALTPIAGTDLISAFLENSMNPVTAQPNESKDRLCYLLTLQSGDVVDIDDDSNLYLEPVVSLKAVADVLADRFQLYPYIDQTTGKLRWEHESFFPQLSYGQAAPGGSASQ